MRIGTTSRSTRGRRLSQGALLLAACAAVTTPACSSGPPETTSSTTSTTSVLQENVAVPGGAFLEVGGAPGPITLAYRGRHLALPAVDWRGTTVVALPPLEPGDTAELTRAGEHVRSVVVVAGEASPSVGDATLAFIDELVAFLDALSTPTDPARAALFQRAKTDAHTSLQRLRDHVLSVRAGGAVTLELTSGDSLPVDASSVAALDALLLAARQGPRPLLGPPPGTAASPLTGDQVTTAVALVGVALAGAAVVGWVGTAAGSAGLAITLLGAPTLGALTDLADGVTSGATAVVTSQDAQQPGTTAADIKAALDSTWGKLSDAADAVVEALTPGTPEQTDASQAAQDANDYEDIINAQSKCPASETECASGCEDTYASKFNCGACGHSCGSPSEIRYWCCAATCVDGDSDPHNCGGCLIECAAGETCSKGKCKPPCPTGTTECGPTCCAAGKTCSDPVAGKCTGCDAGETPCGTNCCGAGLTCGNPATGMCCGVGGTGCGTKCCDAGMQCVDAAAGKCSPCGPTDTECGKACCGPGLQCADPAQSACDACGPLDPGLTCCAGVASDTTTDVQNCGSCGHDCADDFASVSIYPGSLMCAASQCDACLASEGAAWKACYLKGSVNKSGCWLLPTQAEINACKKAECTAQLGLCPPGCVSVCAWAM